MEVGARVVAAGKQGVVRYFGRTDFADGDWVGIELEKPEGKNDGEVMGKRYFTCQPLYGLFCRVQQAQLVSDDGASSSAKKTPPSARKNISSSLASTSSRLQQMRERRAAAAPSAATSSMSRVPSLQRGTASPASSVSSVSSSQSSLGGAGSTNSANRRLAMTPAPASSIPSMAPRSSLDATQKTRPQSVQLDELENARARITELENELRLKTQHVEQLSVTVDELKQSRGAEGAGETDESGDQIMSDVEAVAEVSEPQPSGEDTLTMTEVRAKVEDVRREMADEAELVRAEMEVQISELQSALEEAMEELKIKEQNQSSRDAEIKTLEADIVQHKNRIAQFTLAEQKKAEEIAQAVAKSSTAARKIEQLEAQVKELQEVIELTALEKETLEMDKEIAEERVEECMAEIEKLKTSASLGPTFSADGNASNGSLTDVAEENRKLRLAVKALHDRSAEEKSELTKKLRQLERENSELDPLREEVEELTAKKKKLEEESEELKEMLDLANAYESMVEDLTDKNLTLGEKVAELEANVVSLESLREMAEEMEHQHSEFEAELQKEVEAQRSTVAQLKKSLAEFVTKVEDKDRTIERFRDLTQTNREEIRQLRSQLREGAGELENVRGTAHNALTQSLNLRNLAASARESELEASKQRIVAEQATQENSFFRAVIPHSILSEKDQKMIRVRARLVRVAGVCDILLQSIKKDLEVSQANERIQEDKDSPDISISGDVNVSNRDHSKALLGFAVSVKLALVTCSAKEDSFRLECYRTSEENFNAICVRLDTAPFAQLESALDVAVGAFSEGHLFVGSNLAAYNRLMETMDAWLEVLRPEHVAEETLPVECAVMKLRIRKSITVFGLENSIMMTLVEQARDSIPPEVSEEDSKGLAGFEEQLLHELSSLSVVLLQLRRRADLDLVATMDDLVGHLAVGGDVIDRLDAYRLEAQSMRKLVEEHLNPTHLYKSTKSLGELAAFCETSLVPLVLFLKERVASLYKTICRGALTDSVAPRAGVEATSSGENTNRSQWQVRAHRIHTELSEASSVRASLEEVTQLCQDLHAKVRELERSDSEYRVVRQKLESELLRITDELNRVASENTQLHTQLATEREQFDTALDESQKEKAALDAANRDLRKQLKRASETGPAAPICGAAISGAMKLGVATTEEMMVLRQAYTQLQRELFQVRARLAKQQMAYVLKGPQPSAATSSKPVSPAVSQCLKELSKFSRNVKIAASIPQLVDLTKKPNQSLAVDQLMAQQLTSSQLQMRFQLLRSQLSHAALQEGWSKEVTTAIDRGESVFGWQPPELERPPRRVARLKVGSGATTCGEPVAVVLDRKEILKLTDLLVC